MTCGPFRVLRGACMKNIGTAGMLPKFGFSYRRFVMKPRFQPIAISRGVFALGLVISVSSSGMASAQSVWNGAISSSWNTAGNWSAGVPNGVNAVINLSPANVATVSSSFVATPIDIFVGNASGSNGRLNHTAGLAGTGNANWMFVGVSGGTGTYNLANTAAAGGTFTSFGLGGGSLNVGGSSSTAGRLYVGGRENGGGGNGTVNIHTSGTVKIANDLVVGSSGGTGVVNIDAGTVTTNGWNFFGMYLGGTGGSGTLRMSGGTLTNGTNLAQGCRTYIANGNTTGAIIMSGGTYNNIQSGNDTQFAIGVNNLANPVMPTLTMTGGTLNAARLFTIGGTEPFVGNANDTGPGKGVATVSGANAVLNVTGDLYVAHGTGSVGQLNVNDGLVQSTSWFVIGRAEGTGTLNISGGHVVKGGTLGNLLLGTGTNASGTINQTGGTVTVSFGQTCIGEEAFSGPGAGTYNLVSGTANLGVVRLGHNGTAQGTFNLNGGTANIAAVQSGSSHTNRVFNFNGGKLVATSSSPAYMQGIARANVRNGGALIDSNGFDISIQQHLVHTNIPGDNGTDGGLTKLGAGILTLTAANSQNGPTLVSSGTLEIKGDSPAMTGPVNVASGATLGGNGDLGGGVTIAAGGRHELDVAGVPANQMVRELGGALNLSAIGDILRLKASTPPVAGVYTLLTAIGGISGHNGATLNDTVVEFSGVRGNVSVSGNSLLLEVTPYDFWISGFSSIAAADRDPTDDPDHDGCSNAMEFALGGKPDSGSVQPKIHVFVADSSDADMSAELLMTIAVRDGTPAFSGSPSPTATHDGFTCQIEGSTTLSSFQVPVSPVSPVVQGLPPPPAGYQYRTFALDGSDGLPGAGFMRVHVGQ